LHCDGCKLNHTAMQTRINEAKLMDVPIVNYGVVSSFMSGNFPRVLVPFADAFAEWGKVILNNYYLSAIMNNKILFLLLTVFFIPSNQSVSQTFEVKVGPGISMRPIMFIIRNHTSMMLIMILTWVC
jgi:hypothetical protein